MSITARDKIDIETAIHEGLRQWALDNWVVVTAKMRSEISGLVLASLLARQHDEPETDVALRASAEGVSDVTKDAP